MLECRIMQISVPTVPQETGSLLPEPTAADALDAELLSCALLSASEGLAVALLPQCRANTELEGAASRPAAAAVGLVESEIMTHLDQVYYI